VCGGLAPTYVWCAALPAMGVTARQTSVSDSRPRHIHVPLTPITARTTLGAFIFTILQGRAGGGGREEQERAFDLRGDLKDRQSACNRTVGAASAATWWIPRSRLKPLLQCNRQRSRELADGNVHEECTLLLFSSSPARP